MMSFKIQFRHGFFASPRISARPGEFASLRTLP
jgi:hypothetical protein